MTDHLLLFLFSVGLGLAAAIPVGGVQIEMAKRAIAGHGRAAGMVILGSVTSDIVYGIIAVFGIAPFMESPKVLAAFNVLGAVVMWVVGFLTLRQSRRPGAAGSKRSILKSRRWAYVTGFLVSVSNPPIMLSWLLGVTIAKHLGLASPFPWQDKALYIAGGALGLGSYLGILGAVMHRFKRSIPDRVVGRIYFWLGISLFALSFYFVHGAVKYFIQR